MIRIQIEITPTNIIPLTVPDEQFVSRTDTEAIAREIPGNNSVGSMLTGGEMLVASGDDLNPDGTSKREWLDITFDPTRWPGAHFAEPAFRVLQMKKNMLAAGKQYVWKPDVDGYPKAEEVPVVVVPPPPVQTVPGPGGFPIPVGTPGSASLDWQHILRRLSAWMDALNVPQVP